MYLQKYTILVTTILLQSVLLSKLHCQLLASRILNFAKTPRKQPQAKIPRGIFMPRGIFKNLIFVGVCDMLGCSAYCVAEVFGRVIQEWLRGVAAEASKGHYYPARA